MLFYSTLLSMIMLHKVIAFDAYVFTVSHTCSVHATPAAGIITEKV
jgi:hypothetical protein